MYMQNIQKYFDDALIARDACVENVNMDVRLPSVESLFSSQSSLAARRCYSSQPWG